MKSKVLIVDDHKMHRDGLKTLINLQKNMMVVGEAENGQEAIAKDSRAAPRRHPLGREDAGHGRGRGHRRSLGIQSEGFQ